MQIDFLSFKWFFSLVLLLCLFGCGQREKWNVVIVTFDTTRADHIGSYGFNRIQTPVLDQLANEGSLFEHAYTPIPITLPSHTTIMTGKVPFTHGIRDNGLFVLHENQRTLAEILKQQGYNTAASIGSFPLTAQFGLNQGFDVYDDHLQTTFEDLHGQRIIPKSRLFFDERPAGSVNEAVLPWLEEQAAEPFFLWLHYFDPHHPHEPPPPYGQLYADNLYAGEIAYSDASLGLIIEKLKTLGVYDKTIVVFTSDHGEGNGEHNESTHSLLIYNSTTHVPLIVKHPEGKASQRIAQRVSTADIMPTILDSLGLDIPEDVQGQSLFSLLVDQQQNTVPSKPIYLETLSPRISHNWGELRGFVDGDYKYIHGPRAELFDIHNDPGELENLIESKPDVASSLKYSLERYLEKHAVPDMDASAEIDRATAERLMALGYIQSSGFKVGQIVERLRDDGVPPQDRVADNSSFSMAKTLLYRNRPFQAKGIIGDLLLTDPQNAHYLDLRFKAELMMEDHQSALATINQIAEIQQGYPPPEYILNNMGRLHYLKAEFATALEKYRLAQDIEPTAEGQYLIAQIHQMLQQQSEQTEALNAAIAINPLYIPALLDLGVLNAEQGHSDIAKTYFQTAMQHAPYNPRVFYNYATFLVKSEMYAEAVPHFERAVTLNPAYLKGYLALVDLLMSLGYHEQGLLYFQMLQRIAPNSPETRTAKNILGVP